jgi:catechol 2,3-dioxygenase-like lactoylglutathione lyase family enzyme
MTRIFRISLNVSDLAQSESFFTGVLGFQTSDAWPLAPARARVVTLGSQAIELVELSPPGSPYPPDSAASDLWFQHFAIVTPDMAGTFAKLDETGFVPISHGGPQTLPPEVGAVTAFKFRDPDGHPLELLQFPDRANAPGIDHTAISVSAVAQSVAFYALLGFEIAARQVNTGPAQDRLDGLTDVSVDVVALAVPRAPTPHLELLCYRHPRGRPSLTPARSDIADTALVLAVEDPDWSASRVEEGGFLVSRNGRSAFLRDPDGHAVVVVPL